jgi:hypothetical protein
MLPLYYLTTFAAFCLICLAWFRPLFQAAVVEYVDQQVIQAVATTAQ